MSYTPFPSFFFFFFFNDTATTEIYTLSLHDALPISAELVDHRRIERQARRDDQRATLGDREGQQTMLLEILGRRSEEHTSELQSPCNLVCRLLLEKKKKKTRAFTKKCTL